MSETIKLSKRLETIATYIPKHAYFADIGSDHAYLPTYVCLQDETVKAIAGEVREGPLQSAKKTVTAYGLNDRIEVRLGNGLAVIQDDPVTEVVIAGMGGGLIAQIIDENINHFPNIEMIIAQPNTNAKQVRETFITYGFTLVDEIIMEENDHIYEVLVAKRHVPNQLYTSSIDKQKQLLFGPKLMQEKSAVFLRKWQEEYDKTLYILNNLQQASEIDQEKKAYFERRLHIIEEVISCK